MSKPSLFRYMGGKYYLADNLIPLFPEHACYVEVFGGAANVLLQKPPSKVEVYNDIDRNVYNLFKVLREYPKEFQREVLLTPYHRDVYYEYRELLETEKNTFKRAVYFYTVANASFGGIFGKSWGFSIKKNHAKYLFKKNLRLETIIHRLQEVQIENRDFEIIFKNYDSPDTFFYLDPPYVPETRGEGKYVYEMTLECHETPHKFS